MLLKLGVFDWMRKSHGARLAPFFTAVTQSATEAAFCQQATVRESALP